MLPAGKNNNKKMLKANICSSLHGFADKKKSQVSLSWYAWNIFILSITSTKFFTQASELDTYLKKMHKIKHTPPYSTTLCFQGKDPDCALMFIWITKKTSNIL